MTAPPIAVYPLQWVAVVLLADGGVAHLRPSGPVSAKPAVITTRPCTPLARQASTTSGTVAAGTVTTARSTGSGMSVTEA